MKISEVLTAISGFTEYIRDLNGDIETHGGQARTKWDYVLGVYGPTPVLWVRGVISYIHDPLQAVAIGWEECHDGSRILRPKEDEVMAALGLSQRNYDMLSKAIHLIPPWNKQLRVDLIAACGMEDERTTTYFKELYEREYPYRPKQSC
jgi:hypothetical protein